MVIVVVEDHRQEMLISRYLKNRGFNKHQFYVRKSPPGEGSAERWVRRTFATETNTYRNRQARASTALIAMIDADTRTVRDRLTELDAELIAIGKPPVGNDEKIARLIPKRNVETWILCLTGKQVNEETDYKQTRVDWTEPTRAAALALHRSQQPEAFIDSLQSGLSELAKIAF